MRGLRSLAFCAIACSAAPLQALQALPVVIWHGLGDSNENPGLLELGDSIKKAYDVPVFFIQVANDAKSDQRASFFGRAWDEVALAAEQIRSIPELEHGYDAIGLSQGGVFLRAIAQTLPKPKMRNLITVGSPHLGISQLPACKSSDWLCRSAEYALSAGMWSSFAQNQIVPAQYFRNQAAIADYLLNSGFLKELNNERYGDRQVGGSEDYLGKDGHPDPAPRNETFKLNFVQLQNFIMFAFSEEKTIAPSTSTTFTLLNYTMPETPLPIKLDALPLYQDDYIGLRQLKQAGKVHYGLCVGEHMQIDEQCWKDVLKWVGPQKAHTTFRLQMP